MELFSIQCTTCGTRLKVRNLAAIGQILSCPKCQSFVEVKPPPGWKPPKPEPAAQPAPAPAAKSAPTAEPAASPAEGAPAAASEGDKPAWQQPFGFEHAPRPAWHFWAAVGTAAVFVFLMTALFWPKGDDPAVAEKTDPVVDAPVDPTKVEEPAKQVDPAKAVEPEKKGPEVDPTKEPPKADPTKGDPTKTPETDPGKGPIDPTKVDPSKADPSKTNPGKIDPTKKVETKLPDPATDPVKPPVEPVKPIVEPIKPARPDPAPNPGIPQAEVEARLQTAIESIQSPAKLMLTDAIDALGQIANLKITLDIESLSQAGVSAEDPVSFDMSKCTVADVLDRVLEQRGLVYLIEAGQLRVTSRKEERDVVRERTQIGDLTKNELGNAKPIVAFIEAAIEPGTWQQRPIGVTERQLEVTHSEWVHRRINALLAKLRLARGLTPQAPAAVDQALASRVSRAAGRLSKPLTVNIAEMPLSRAVTTLSARAECKILIDSIALDAAGQHVDMKATVQTKQPLPLEQILATMLTPLELAYRVIDEKTLLITSRQAAAETLDLEFYKARDLAATPTLAIALIERIEREVAPGTWFGAANVADPKPKVLGGIAYDPVSGDLIVSHTQAVQAGVEDLLDTIRRPAERVKPAAEPKEPKK